MVAVARGRLVPGTDEVRLRLKGDVLVIVTFGAGVQQGVVTDPSFTVNRFDQIREAAEQTIREAKGTLRCDWESNSAWFA